MDKPPPAQANEPQDPGGPDFPEVATVRRARWRLQLVWLVPLVAVLIGGWLAVKAVLEQGPTVTISFKTGDGLEAGKTRIKFKNVEIGTVRKVVLSNDHTRVIATAELTKNASDMLVDDSRFWVVQPRISGGTVSGLGTLLSGSFVSMDPGKSKVARHDFIGLETPPVIATGEPGSEFVLKGEDMGSLDVGSPVFFRRLQVGQVTSYALDQDGNGVTVHVFVNAPYDRYVTTGTRFWQASGIDVSLDAAGVRVNTQSLVSILIGGLAFQTPKETTSSEPAAARSEFVLYHDREEAMKHPDRIVVTYVFKFKESVRGLVVGAPVEFWGIPVGEVTAINTRFDRTTMGFTIPVEVQLFPERFTSRYASGEKGGRLTSEPHRLAQLLVERGLRAQLRTGSLLTGQRYIALDFFPNAPRASVDLTANPPELPTIPGGLQSLQDSVSSLVAKMNKVPFEGIGNRAQQTLADADRLVKTLDSDVAPEARATLAAARTAIDSANGALQPDSALTQNTVETMREMSRAAAALRTLADYLERHPEALLRGKTEVEK
ncbi:intermembrane transport protein PqiB [Paraburkholderia terrae]|uniref:Paraquat-inducible protein n=1 Tax=Paraburkholderia terrae TaxID=311230 RepID=A0ABN6JJP9_9BURK|nr:MlaD family protein [Paraburkholderia terrae]BCZ81128.1 paraquat-inducible protein [Paraburkholderia terrae]BDC40407.1 paraquat-inducible protein [Paraburkholderia terrae]